MSLENLNTSNFKFDPKSDTFKEEMEVIPEFAFKNKHGHSKVKLLTYIALMCDSNSEIRRNYTHYGKRKKEAALHAGFNLQSNGKFKSDLENLFVGEDEDFNKAMIKYLSLSFDPNFVRLNIFQQLAYKTYEQAVLTGESKYVKLADDLTEKLRKEETFIFGGEEVTAMREELYKEAARKELDIKPEDIAYGLSKGENFSSFSKYGEDYAEHFAEFEKLKFVGDEEPQDE